MDNYKKNIAPFDTTGCLLVGLSSSSESLLLDAAGFLTDCWATGLAVGVDLTGDTGVFFFVLSSDESESDDVSFFLVFVRAAGGGIAAFFTGELVAAM